MNPLAVLGTISSLIDIATRLGATVQDGVRAYNLIKALASKPINAVTQADLDPLEAEIEALEARILAPLAAEPD